MAPVTNGYESQNYLIVTYASINVKPEEGGTPGICGAFDFSEEFLEQV